MTAYTVKEVGMRKRLASSLTMALALVSFTLAFTDMVLKIPEEILLRTVTIGLGLVLIIGLVMLIELIFGRPPWKK
jgi:hypothetical protein